MNFSLTEVVLRVTGGLVTVGIAYGFWREFANHDPGYGNRVAIEALQRFYPNRDIYGQEGQ